MMTRASAAAATAVLLKGVGRGLLDEELMDTVVQDIGLVGDGVAILTGCVVDATHMIYMMQHAATYMVGHLR